jgi:RNA polymerase sigma-70 factor (ECF subfamily)
MKVCGHRQDAEDTMQDVLMCSLPHLAKIDDPRALAVWLYTVTRNRCWRSRRKGAHDPVETLSLDGLMPDGPELQRLLADKGAGPEERAALGEQNRVLHKAVLSLPVQYRMVLVLHDMEDLDTEQVVKVLELKPATVRVRLHRARLGVRKAMSELLNGAVAVPVSDSARSKRRHRPSVLPDLGRPNNLLKFAA